MSNFDEVKNMKEQIESLTRKNDKLLDDVIGYRKKIKELEEQVRMYDMLKDVSLTKDIVRIMELEEALLLCLNNDKDMIPKDIVGRSLELLKGGSDATS